MASSRWTLIWFGLTWCGVSAGWASTPPERLTLDREAFQSKGTSCLDISHRETDLVAEYRSSDGEIRLRAGSWMGRDARFLLPEPDSSDIRIDLRRLTGAPLAAGALAVRPCPAEAEHPSITGLVAAQNLRLARYQGQLVETAEIQAHFDQALGSLDDLPTVWRAIAHYELATFQRGLNELDLADLHFTQALQEFGSVAANWGHARALNGRGLVAWRAGRTDQAWDYFDQALRLWESVDNSFEIATIYNNMGLLLTQTGRNEEAAETLEMALDYFQGPVDLRLELAIDQFNQIDSSAVDLPAALQTLNNLARAERGLGRTAIAERYWRTYIALGDLLPESTAAAKAQLNLGDLLFQNGQIDEALMLLINAQAVFEMVDARTWNAHALSVLGQVYWWMGDQAMAAHQFERAERLSQTDTNIRAKALTMLAQLNISADSRQLARQQLEEAEALFAASQAVRSQREVRARLIELDCIRQHLESCLEQTMALYELVRNDQGHRLAPALASRMGELNYLLNRSEQAERLLLQALAAQVELNDHFEQLKTLRRLGRIYQEQDHPDELAINQRAVDLIEDLQQGHLPPMRRTEYLAISRSTYDRQVLALLDRGRVISAWKLAEQARGRGLRELRSARQQRLNNPQRQSLLDERASLIGQRFTLTQSDQDIQDRAKETELSRLALQLDGVEVELQKLDSETAMALETPEMAAVQASLRDDEKLLSYFLTDDRVILWNIGVDSVDWVDLGQTTQIESMIGDLVVRLRHPRQAMGAISQRIESLRQRLIVPARIDPRQVKKLAIQPDGVLHSLPFVLLLSGSEEDWPDLLQSMSPQREPLGDTGPDKVASQLIVADPLWADNGSGMPPFPENSLIGRLARDQSSGRLPGTRREAEAIAALGSSLDNTSMRLGSRATREFVISGGLAGFDQIHLATHGLVDLDYPEYSALLLASESTLGPAFLRPHEIAELDLDADLVVLSGCETGAGKILAGEGALSLARPFLIAGAEQVLASLWKIDDHRTAEFMQRFYQHLLNDGDSAARALSRAQNWMRRQPGTTHPYYWAGFILIRA